MTIVTPRVNYDYYSDPQMGWKDVVGGGIETIELPVNPHAMLVEPYVRVLAERLKDAIDRAMRVALVRLC